MISEKRIALTTYQGGIVCAQAGYGWMLHSNRDQVFGWEVLTFVPLNNGQVAIRTAHGFYVSALTGLEEWTLQGYSATVQDWERFTPVATGKYIALETVHGRFVTAEPREPGAVLRAEATEIREPQRFGGGEVVPAPPEGAPALAFAPFAGGGWIFHTPLQQAIEKLVRPDGRDTVERNGKQSEREEPAERKYDGPIRASNGIAFWF